MLQSYCHSRYGGKMFSSSILSGISCWVQAARVIRAGGQHPSPEPGLIEPQRCQTWDCASSSKEQLGT